MEDYYFKRKPVKFCCLVAQTSCFYDEISFGCCKIVNESTTSFIIDLSRFQTTVFTFFI